MLAGIVGLAVAAVHAPTKAERVLGQVRGSFGPAPNEARSGYWKVWNGVVKPNEPRRTGASALAVITGSPTTAPIGCSVVFSGGGLSGSTLAARTGSTLSVHNQDPFTHKLVIEELAEFAPMETPPGKSRNFKVAPGGPWVIGDAYHGHVRAHLHAISDLVACATIDARGRFRFANVAPGTYVLRVLSGTKEVVKREVTVLAGQALELEPLAIPRKESK